MESGNRIERLPLNDMCDVLHYYFEVESVVDSEFADARQEVRGQLYGKLYGRKYTWGANRSSTREFGTQEVGMDPASGVPELEHKPYVPPTPFDPSSTRPYGSLLDAPLG